MQLIEIVQLALVGFVAIILVIFFVSYISFKAKKNLLEKNFIPDKDNSEIEDLRDTEHFASPKMEKKSEVSYKESKSQKFVVFNPDLTDSQKPKSSVTKKHFPRTLLIKK